MATATIHDILDELRASSTSERDKGDKFERLIQTYLKTDFVYANQFSDGWLWQEYPDRLGRPDTGIDLVAKDRESGALTAIQCKFYARHHYLQKSDLDSFFTASGKLAFSRRLVVSTTDRWSRHAEDALEGQQVETLRLDLRMLDESNIDWSQFSLATPEVMERRDRKVLRAHQVSALRDVRAGFESADRGRLIMACGTGKTFTSLRIAEDLVAPGGSVLFLVPSTEIVDFILRGVEQVLRSEFGSSLNDRGVHVLDPFTGTGTFIVRLLQSGLVTPADLLYKYTHELHANEINLLAYYVAAVNIEATYHGLHAGGGGDYRPFDGIVLTDTFQMFEEGDAMDELIFPRNNDRVVAQKDTDIRVVVGNPPYSSGQTSANDDNANVRYPTLDARIESTYAARSTATNKNSLYDSYIRAIRWASDRVGDQGVIGYVSNGGYIDSNTADGLRKSLAEEFDAIYVFNLRGNQRTSGELSRQEGGKVFGSGSRTTVAITFLVKVKTAHPAGSRPSRAARLFYRDVGDYLTREQKLDLVATSDLDSVEWDPIAPNEHGDRVNQRRSDFAQYTPLGDKGRGTGVFNLHSRGVATGRDAWVYNFSTERLHGNVKRMVAAYNSEVPRLEAGREPDLDPRRLSWNRADRVNARRGMRYTVSDDMFCLGAYRPFTKQRVCFARSLNDMVYQLPKIFPTADHENVGFYCVGMGSAVAFSVVMLDSLPDLHVTGAGSGGQFFPR